MGKLFKFLSPYLLFILGIIFLSAGLTKLFPLNGFLLSLRGYALPFPHEILAVCSIPLICLEIWIGLSLILRSYLHLALLLSQILFSIFIPVIIWGIFNEAPTCGCFGEHIIRSPWIAAVESVIFLILSIYLYKQYKSHNTLSSFQSTIIKIVIYVLVIVSALYGLQQLSNM